MESIEQAAGAALRQSRLAVPLSLRDVMAMSRGRFKPSAVGAYERAERAITLERFCSLAVLYGVPADRLLADALARVDPEQRRSLVIDLRKLSELNSDGGEPIRGYVEEIRQQRNDLKAEVITLRAGDIEVLARVSGLEVEPLLRTLEHAIRVS